MEKTSMKNKKKSLRGLWITLISIGSLIIVLVTTFFIYVSIYYKPTDHALTYLSDSNYSKVEEKSDYITFSPKVSLLHEGLIFYPGGKVDYRAYAPVLRDLSDVGITSVLVKAPFNLAVLNPNMADHKQELFPNITNWFIGGHSLGGAMAASYLSSHTKEYKGLILEGAYSTKDMSSTSLKTLSFLASEDKVLKKTTYENNKKYLPSMTEHVIEGGIHSYYGDYGLQRGDGTPTITEEQQRKEIVKTGYLFMVGTALSE